MHNIWHHVIYAALLLAKIAAICVFLLCKIFGPKIWSCKTFDKFQVCLRQPPIKSFKKKSIFKKIFSGLFCYPRCPQISLHEWQKRIVSSSLEPRHVYLTNIWCILILRHLPMNVFFYSDDSDDLTKTCIGLRKLFNVLFSLIGRNTPWPVKDRKTYSPR